MNYKLVKLPKFSDEAASIYSVFLTNENKTLFEIFVEKNKISFISELKDIFKRLKVIGDDTGARDIFFKLNEGSPGDLVCALYDEPDSNLRLYCIRYGTLLVILGGGGYKPKSISAFQEDEKLTKENYLMREISKDIYKRIKDHEIVFVNDHKDFEGNLEFYEDQE
jgi:uncharacterized pyridoxamine 5'-phosphate oxidase family protein